MKFFIISLSFVAQLLLVVNVVAMPQSQVAIQNPTSQSSPITAQSVNSGIAFTQNFMQIFSTLFNNFNSFVPRFINLFTGQNPIAGPGAVPSAPGVPSLSDIPGLPSLPSIQAVHPQPEKINKQPNQILTQSPKKDIELIDNEINDILSA